MSDKITKKFTQLKSEAKSALVSFVMAGDPSLEISEAVMEALIDSGTDILEIGMPFSDPVADGVAIQNSGKRALKTDVTLNKILDLAKRLTNKYQDLPIILMGYFNPIHKFGVDAFCQKAKASGVSGFIIVDLPYEERSRYDEVFNKNDIAFINLISPNTSVDRAKKILIGAKGFVYYVSVNATTGSQEPVIQDIENNLINIRTITDLPIAVGFGIKTKDQAKAIGEFSDAIVVGSRYISFIEAKAQENLQALKEFNSELKSSLI
jgi:tryptophan synthase alpha chain